MIFLVLIALVEGFVLLRILEISFPCQSILYPHRFEEEGVFSKESNSNVSISYSSKLIQTTESTDHVSEVAHLNATKSEDMSSEKGHGISHLPDAHQPLVKTRGMQNGNDSASNYHSNVFCQVHLVWGVRTKVHHDIPPEIVQQRISSMHTRTIVEI